MITLADRHTDDKNTLSTITHSALQTLSRRHEEPCVSIIMPTVIKGDTAQNSIRFKNLLRISEDKLRKYGLNQKETQQLLEKPTALLSDDLFWEFQTQGLAIYVSPDHYGVYHIPLTPPELANVTNRFYIKPLIPIFTNNGRFFLLTLSQKSVHLYEGTRTTFHKLGVEFPSIDDFSFGEPQIQQHSQTRGNQKEPVQFHGQGARKYDKKVEIQKLLQEIERRVRSCLHGEQSPLLLAGVEYLVSRFHNMNTYPHLLQAGIMGNPEHLKNQDLHRKALQIVNPLFDESQSKALDRFHKLKLKEKTSSDMQKILASADQGLVDTLFVAQNSQIWGLYEPKTSEILIHDRQQDRDEDLLDLACMMTMSKGGAVYVIDSDLMPEPTSIAALYRYNP